MKRAPLGPTLVLLLAACGGGAGTASGTIPAPEPAATARASKSPGTTITRPELDGTGVATLYDAVARLRPSFLRDRGPTSVVIESANRKPVVFVNETEYGSVDTMRTIQASRVDEVRFYSGTEAATRFGSKYGAGVLAVKMRSQ